MKLKAIISAFALFALLSFTSSEKALKFDYPKQKGTEISLSSDHFKKFKEEWRGSDYYYFGEGDGFVCSVLFYKLNEDEKLSLVEVPKAAMKKSLEAAGKEISADSPMFAYAYFKNFSNLKSMEVDDQSWGLASDDFMFRKNKVPLEGTNFVQTHMYGYAMFGNDLFVNIHLSKMNCSENDTKEMEAILNSLVKSGK